MQKPLKILLVCSLFGILLLIFVSNNLNTKQINISEINKTNINDFVLIKGKIIDLKFFEDSDFYILTIFDETGKIKGTLNSKSLSLNNTKEYLFLGKIEVYKNETQINIQKIIYYDN